jgi:2-iminobutanoate/2-iminopropanoate deaminase
MEKRPINPWTWQEGMGGFSQAWKVDGAQSIVFVAGQGPLSADGQVVGANNFEAQARQTFENLRVVLEHAGASFDAVVKVSAFMTDITNLRDYWRVRSEFMTGPASTAFEVSSLALPGMMIEVEAIAVL